MSSTSNPSARVIFPPAAADFWWVVLLRRRTLSISRLSSSDVPETPLAPVADPVVKAA